MFFRVNGLCYIDTMEYNSTIKKKKKTIGAGNNLEESQGNDAEWKSQSQKVLRGMILFV